MEKTFAQLGFGREFAWIDLANSLELDGFGVATDHLENPAWIAAFLRHWKLAAELPRPAPLAELRALRKLLRRIGDSLADSGRISSNDLETLNSVMKVASVEKLVQHQNGWGVEIVPVRGGWPWILARITGSLVQMLKLGKTECLKICPNQGCLWLFYDQTKGNTRRWCSDRTCGNRDRVRRARAGLQQKGQGPRA